MLLFISSVKVSQKILLRLIISCLPLMGSSYIWNAQTYWTNKIDLLDCSKYKYIILKRLLEVFKQKICCFSTKCFVFIIWSEKSNIVYFQQIMYYNYIKQSDSFCSCIHWYEVEIKGKSDWLYFQKPSEN